MLNLVLRTCFLCSVMVNVLVLTVLFSLVPTIMVADPSPFRWVVLNRRRARGECGIVTIIILVNGSKVLKCLNLHTPLTFLVCILGRCCMLNARTFMDRVS